MKRFRPGDIVRWQGITCRVLSREGAGYRIMPPIGTGGMGVWVPAAELSPGPQTMRMVSPGESDYWPGRCRSRSGENNE